MTRFAFDRARRVLVHTWATSAGDVAGDVTSVPPSVGDDLVLRVVKALNRLDDALWRTYTEPASAALDDLSANTKGWRREADRRTLDRIGEIIRNPNLPSDGMIVRSYIPTEEAAHVLGRALHRVDVPAFTDAVTSEIDAEAHAVDQAELGDFSDRSAQATLLTRAEASPLHVAAAHELFSADPFGARVLGAELDPTSAAVAAAHWLHCAATVAADVSDYDVDQIVIEADDIEALPVATPTEVLSRLVAGDSPFDIVVEMVRAALAVARGRVADPRLLGDLIETAEQGPEDDGIRLCLLDPARPAPDLLEDLLYGIHGSFLIWDELESDDESDEVDDEEDEEDEWATRHEQRRQEFADRVRAIAQENVGRLGLL